MRSGRDIAQAVDVREIVRPVELTGADAADFRAAAEVGIRARRHQWGDDDHSESLPEQYARAADTAAERWRGWIAVDGAGGVLGLLTATLPLRENPTVARVDVVVDPDHQRRGVGSALMAVAEQDLRAAGRTVLTGLTETAGTGPWPDPVPARSGAGAVPADAPEVAFARRHGYVLEQVERLGRLDVPVAPATLRAWSAALPEHPDHELTAWSDAASDDTAADYAQLKTAMSTDVPLADLEQDEEDWDAGRVADEEAELAAGGGHRLVTAVRHLSTGRLVGHTVLERFDARPAVAYQQDTLVLSAHRGHRLGMLLKIDNLRRLATAWPEVRRVYTWNAEENTPVLAINVELGFRQAGVVGAWQKRLS